MLPKDPGPIGVFDSGYGGLTILKEIRAALPQYDYLYLGDNARAPYGTRSFPLVLEFTTQAVHRLFAMGCHLVILACNTASAKALRTIQQQCLPQWDADRRVLGVIRPTTECVASLTRTRHIGVMATEGTIASHTYDIEITKLHPGMVVTGQPCPMWVPLVENGEADSEGADYFVRKDINRLLQRDPLIDTIILGCTHYPLLLNKIRQYAPPQVRIVAQGEYVARSLADYLTRHTGLSTLITRTATTRYLTTEDPSRFNPSASLFMGTAVEATHITLDTIPTFH